MVHIKEPYSSLAEAEHDMAGIALLSFLFEVPQRFVKGKPQLASWSQPYYYHYYYYYSGQIAFRPKKAHERVDWRVKCTPL